MRLSCPACNAEMSLEVALGREADARALAEFVERNVALGATMVRYIALFRPDKRRLSLARTVALFMELAPDIERGAVTRKGRDWPAPLQVWRAAIEQVLGNRDKGTLTLPLASHGYLYEVIVGLADKAEGLVEREREDQRRQAGRSDGAGPAHAVAAIAAGALAPPPYDPAKGPSRAARELHERIAAAQRRHTATPSDEAGAAP